MATFEDISSLPVENLILKELSLKDLLSCKLVFKNWEHCITKNYIFPKCVRTIYLGRIKDLGRYFRWRKFEESNAIKPSEYYLRSPQFFTRLFHHVNVHNFMPCDPFFSYCGRNISSLTLALQYKIEDWCLPHFKQLLTTDCPNLEMFRVWIQDNDEDWCAIGEPMDAMEWMVPNLKHLSWVRSKGQLTHDWTSLNVMAIICDKCPNLTKISIEAGTDGLVQFPSGIVHRVLQNRNTLKGLHLTGAFVSQNTLTSILNWNNHLIDLSICLHGHYDLETTFQGERIKKSLKRLCLSLPKRNSDDIIPVNYTLTLPAMPNIEDLKFINWISSSDLVVMTKTFQKLKSVAFILKSETNVSLDFESAHCRSSVTVDVLRFEITNQLMQIPTEIVSSLRRAFPYLHSLHLKVHDKEDILRDVITHFDDMSTLTQLSLNVTTRKESDFASVLTGIPGEDLDMDLNNPDEKWPKCQDRVASLPFIGQMKHIRQVQIKVETLRVRMISPVINVLQNMKLLKLRLYGFQINFDTWIDDFSNIGCIVEDFGCDFLKKGSQSFEPVNLRSDDQMLSDIKSTSKGFWKFRSSSDSNVDE